MADAYEVVRGPMKLKGTSNGGKKKKKKKKEKEKMKKVMEEAVKQASQQDVQPVDTRTAAQIAYDKKQEKRAAEKILKKAEKTHKQRVEEFNVALDNLTEHYDIPKVSWTK